MIKRLPQIPVSYAVICLAVAVLIAVGVGVWATRYTYYQLGNITVQLDRWTGIETANFGRGIHTRDPSKSGRWEEAQAVAAPGLNRPQTEEDIEQRKRLLQAWEESERKSK